MNPARHLTANGNCIVAREFAVSDHNIFRSPAQGAGLKITTRLNGNVIIAISEEHIFDQNIFTAFGINPVVVKIIGFKLKPPYGNIF